VHNKLIWRPSQRCEEDGNAETFEYGSRDCAFVEATPLCLDGADSADSADAMFPATLMSMNW
jgi:hypothetical protein